MTDHDNADDADGQKNTVSRRMALTALGVGAVGGSAATSAYSELTADRPIDVEVSTEGDAELSEGSSELIISNNSTETLDATIVADDSDLSIVNESGDFTEIISEAADEWELIGLTSSSDATIEFVHSDEVTNVTFSVEAFSGTPGFSISSTQLVEVGTQVVPESSIYHWPFSEGSGTTVGERLQNQDATLEGPNWVSNSWFRDNAIDTDGDSDYVDLNDTLTDWQENLVGTWTLAFTVETTDDKDDDDRDPIVFGTHNSGSWELITVGLGATRGTQDDIPSGYPNILIATGSDSRHGVYVDDDTEDAINDGNKHRVVWTGRGTDVSDIECYIDGSEVDVVVDRDDGTPDLEENPIDEHNVYFGAWHDTGEPANHYDGNLDNLVLAESDWSTTEISDDYDNQPWSN